MALYVPLDADYYHDPKLIEAGPMAELLYVRGLGFAKRTEKDGWIADSQLRDIGAGLSRPRALADRLCAVGAWERVGNGWQITAWLKRNKSAAQIAHAKEAARMKSLIGNHERWHIKESKYDPTCELCNPYRDPRSDPRGDPKQREAERSESRAKPEGSEGKQSEGKSEFQLLPTSTVGTRPDGLEDDLDDPRDEDGEIIVIAEWHDDRRAG